MMTYITVPWLASFTLFCRFLVSSGYPVQPADIPTYTACYAEISTNIYTHEGDAR